MHFKKERIDTSPSDGSLLQKDGSSGIQMHQGLIATSLRRLIMFVEGVLERSSVALATSEDCPVLLAETMTIKEAIKQVIQMSTPNVILESDSLIAINAIT